MTHPPTSTLPAQDGWTGLMLAADKGHLDLARLLLDKGASVSAKDEVVACPEAPAFPPHPLNFICGVLVCCKRYLYCIRPCPEASHHWQYHEPGDGARAPWGGGGIRADAMAVVRIWRP